MSIIPNICSAISSVTLTRTRFNKAINQTLTRRGRPFGAEFGWLGSGADAAHGVGTAPRPLVTRGECPPPARQQGGQFPAGLRPGPHPDSPKSLIPGQGEAKEICLLGGSDSRPEAEPAVGWVPRICSRRRRCPTRARKRRPAWGCGHPHRRRRR